MHYFVIFELNKYDFSFVYKFELLSYKHVNISEYALVKINEYTSVQVNDKFYIMNLIFRHNRDNIKKYKNLRKLVCRDNYTDEDIKQLKYLKYIDINGNNNITIDGLKHLNLTTIKDVNYNFKYYNSRIDYNCFNNLKVYIGNNLHNIKLNMYKLKTYKLDDEIKINKHLYLFTLVHDVPHLKNITHMFLHKLNYYRKIICNNMQLYSTTLLALTIDDDIKNQKHLAKLKLYNNIYITAKIINKLNLKELIVYNNTKLSKLLNSNNIQMIKFL